MRTFTEKLSEKSSVKETENKRDLILNSQLTFCFIDNIIDTKYGTICIINHYRYKLLLYMKTR